MKTKQIIANCEFDILESKGGVKAGIQRASYGNSDKDITDRDRQAMYNFYRQGISLETIAENYGCKVAYVVEMINTRPWLHPAPKEDVVNMTWLESDHSDPLELVKVFFTGEEVAVKEVDNKLDIHAIDWKASSRSSVELMFG